MSAGCGHEHGPFDGMSDTYKRRLWLVILINAAMFAVEMTAGQLARSQALQADALDFFADAVTYGISLAVIGASLKVRSMAAAAKGISLFFMGLWVFSSTVWRVFYDGTCRRRRSIGRDRLHGARRQCVQRAAADELQGRRRQCALRLALLAQ